MSKFQVGQRVRLNCPQHEDEVVHGKGVEGVITEVKVNERGFSSYAINGGKCVLSEGALDAISRSTKLGKMWGVARLSAGRDDSATGILSPCLCVVDTDKKSPHNKFWIKDREKAEAVMAELFEAYPNIKYKIVAMAWDASDDADGDVC